jgi:hypothetical protein
MFGNEKLERLRQQKQVLVLESAVNRLSVQAELRSLNVARARLTGALAGPRRLTPILLIATAVLGFVLMRRREALRPGRLFSLAKWGFSLFQLWRRFSGSSRKLQNKAAH